jgi:ribosomal protein S18 acetylase RimI-like enzyme
MGGVARLDRGAGAVSYRISEADHTERETAEAILRVQQAAYRIESDLIEYEIPTLRMTVEELQASKERYLVARTADEIVGAVAWEETDDGVWINSLTVSPEHFRRGIGAMLLEAVERAASGAKALLVSTGEKNEPAILLYQKRGFSISKRRTLDDGLRLVELKKILN